MKINSDTIKVMSLFEKVTGARLKDCIVDGVVWFIVYPNQIGKAIGRNGSNIRKIEHLLNKRAIVKEFSEDKIQFVKNLIEIKVDNVGENEGHIEIKCTDNKSKNILIGRNRHRINFIEEVVKRHFDIEGLRVL